MSVEIIRYGNPLKGSQKSIEKGNLELAMRITAQAKELSPFDSGKLKGSIMWKTDKQSGGKTDGKDLSYSPKKDEAVIGSATEYAAYQEFGTRRMAAQPFLRPAVLLEVLGPNGQNTMKKATIEAMKEALSKRGKK